ncbi:hypothetical protein V6U78_05960 [Marinospirillum sp. MEB164]|uniref:Uncharacterized protein n=1 Tax=Marinospirillum alkalitolerans TaxID=3123374 RepID=A0ABW8PXK2_9GAMM
MPCSQHNPPPLTAPTGWQWQEAAYSGGWYLYALHQDECLHLGAFASPALLAVQKARFIEAAQTCVHLKLLPEEIAPWLKGQGPAPRFVGLLGTAWSGYRVQALDTEQVEVIYAADLRLEWLGVFNESEAFSVIEQHYDRRRQGCLIC